MSTSMAALQSEHGGRAPLLVILKDMYRKAMGTGICLHRSPLGNLEWCGSFTGDFEVVQEGYVNGASLSMGAL